MTDFALEKAPIEICPVCESTLSLYTTVDIFDKHKHRWCRNCHTELVYSGNGWVKA